MGFPIRDGKVAEHKGSALREARRSVGIGLSRVAYQGRLSVSHLSRVERGERPVTPAIVAAYQRALGVRRTGLPVPLASPLALLAGGALVDERLVEDAGEMRRRRFNATIAAVAVGAGLAEPVDRLLERAGGPARSPARVGMADVVQVEQAQDMFTAWHLRYGGGLAAGVVRSHLRFAVGLLDSAMSDPVARRLHTAVGTLAVRAAWTMFDAGQQSAAFDLFALALHSAGQAGRADLRAAVLTELATQHYYLGQVQDSLAMARLAAGDERMPPAVRCMLHTVNARGHAVRGDAEGAVRQVGLAEEAFTQVTADNTPAWMTRFVCPAQVQALTGQAAFILARDRDTDAGGRFAAQAYTRLGAAIEELDPAERVRAMALCTTRLAALHLSRGDLDEGVRVGRQAVAAASGVRSVRIARDVRAMRTEAVAQARDPEVRALIGEIDRVLTPAA